MAISACSPPALTNQQWGLKRKDLGTCPLGAIGNLQFKPGQGGTARASRIGVLLSKIRRSLSNLVFFLTSSHALVRARRAQLVQVRENSRRVGDLLGRLTAAAGAAKEHSLIGQKLKRLCKTPGGDLSSLPGGREALSRYLDELSDADLVALRCGVLNDVDAILDQVSPDPDSPSRSQAYGMLRQIKLAVRSRFERKVVQEPFRQIARLLSDTPVDRHTLQQSLRGMAKGFEQFKASLATSPLKHESDPLDIYFGPLSKKQWEELLTLGLPEKCDELVYALGEAKTDKGASFNALDQFAQALHSRLTRSVQAPLAQIAELLSARPMDGRQLEAALLKLGSSPAGIVLERYLPSLPEEQLKSLLILGRRDTVEECLAALAEIDADRGPARDALDKIMDALESRRAQSAHGSLAQIAGLLTARSIDGRKLEESLRKLDSLLIGELDRHLRSLPEDVVEALLPLAHKEARDECRASLLKAGITDEQEGVSGLLDRIHGRLVHIEQNRHHVDNLLASLSDAAPMTDGRHAAANDLSLLAGQLDSELADLWMGPAFLLKRIGSLSATERVFARMGPLGSDMGREALLSMALPDDDELRGRGAHVLEQIRRALIQRLAEDFAPAFLKQIAGLLSASPIDGRQLRRQLESLDMDVYANTSLVRGDWDGTRAYEMLDNCLPSLPAEILQELLLLARPAKLDECLAAMENIEAVEFGDASAMLIHIHQALLADAAHHQKQG